MNRNCFYKRVKVNRFSGSGYIPRFKLKITKENLKGALNNDLVLCKFPDYRDKEPKVIKIVERFKTNFVVEVLSLLRQGVVVFFDDPQISGKRVILGNFPKVQEGHKILVHLQVFPPERMQGNLLKILGFSGDALTDFKSLFYDLKLPDNFEREEQKSEIDLLKKKRESILTNTELYRSLEDKCFFTIDGVKAKDFDDAICTEKLKNGFKLYIAIADVWSYLKHTPKISEEANNRGSSIYLLNRVITMLPPILSEDLCSLREGEKKNTICVSIEMTFRGEFKKSSLEIFPAFIRSRKRFTYEQLNKHVNGQERFQFFDQELESSVLNSYEAAQLIIQDELDKGKDPIRICQDKIYYQLDEREQVIGITKSNDELCNFLTFEKVIEKYMVLSNNLVGELFKKHNLKTIYRVHKVPEHSRINNFLYDMQRFQVNSPIYIEATDITTQKLNLLLSSFKENTHFQIIQYNFLLTLPKAEYSLLNIGHFGLNSPNYLHFTSPIRRLPDLLVHKALWMHFLSPNLYSASTKERNLEELDKLVYLSNLGEQRAIAAERRFVSRKLYKYLVTKYPSQQFKGVIATKTEFGFNVRIANYYEGYIKTENCKSPKKIGDVIALKKIEYSWDEFIEI